MKTQPIRPYTIQEDYIVMKKQIKKWENNINEIINKITNEYISQKDVYKLRDSLEYISQEMFAINN